MTATKKIGLFGFGCVGQGLYDVLIANPAIPLSLEKVCVKDKNKERNIPENLLCYDKKEILNDTSIDLVVELIDDADEAYAIVVAALQSGKDVVSANKKMIADHLEELIGIQQEYGTSLLYEAAVCGSIPVIRNLEEYYGFEQVKNLQGICNGSSNYILSGLYDEGLSYDEVVKTAQDLGFAESNPQLDVGGFDAKYKLCILVAHAFGKVLPPDDILNLGIQHIRAEDIERAKANGQKIKLVAHAALSEENELNVSVLPQFVTEDNTLFSIDKEWNAVAVEGAFSQAQLFVGKGAGDHPTAASVWSDITAWLKDYRYSYPKIHQEKSLNIQDELLTVYVSANQEADLDKLPCEYVISRQQSEKGHSQIIRVKRSVLLRFSHVIDEAGLFIAQTDCSAGNITERKRTEKALILE